jgi:hypothetical protein
MLLLEELVMIRVFSKHFCPTAWASFILAWNPSVMQCFLATFWADTITSGAHVMSAFDGHNQFLRLLYKKHSLAKEKDGSASTVFSLMPHHASSEVMI